MASGTNQIELDHPIETVWDFISDMNKWAPLVPGYVEHKILNNHQSTWEFIGDLGFIQKSVNLKIDIVEWDEQTKLLFDLTGINENLLGRGYFETQAITNIQTKLTGYLNITAKGMKGPMINPFLKSFVPETTKVFTEAIATKITTLETVRK